jgi:hypothetical protein
MDRKLGFSSSWKRMVGISGFKGKISRKIEISLSGMLALLGVVLIATAAQAAYIWTDDNGRIRFADTYQQIPEKYRKGASGSPTPEWKPMTQKEQEESRTRQGTKVTGGEGEKARPSGDWTITASGVTKFQVVAQYESNLSILVTQNTTAEQLKALIFEFRAARKSNTLSKMIPATTRGDRLGDYVGVCIFVFSEPDWATSDKLKRFIELNPNSAADAEFDKEYVKHVKAQYSSLIVREQGNLVYSEAGNLGYYDGIVRSPNHEKLF